MPNSQYAKISSVHGLASEGEAFMETFPCLRAFSIFYVQVWKRVEGRISSASFAFTLLKLLGAYTAIVVFFFAATGLPAAPPLLFIVAAPYGMAALLALMIFPRLRRAEGCVRKILEEGPGAVPCVPGTVVVDRDPPWSHRIKNLVVRFVRAGGPLSGLFDFPGCRVEEGPCRGLLLAFVDLKYSLRGCVTASSVFGDWAKAELEPAGPGQVRVKMECTLRVAKAARLRLALAEVTCDRSGTYEQVVDLRGSEWPAVFITAHGAPGTLFLDRIRERDPCRDDCKMVLTLELPKGKKVEKVGKAEFAPPQGGDGAD